LFSMQPPLAPPFEPPSTTSNTSQTINEIHDYKSKIKKRRLPGLFFLVSILVLILGTFFKSAKPPLAVSRSLRVRFY
jgi:hypothetical protein